MAARHTMFYGVKVYPRDKTPDITGLSALPFIPAMIQANPALVTAGGDVFAITDQSKPTPNVLYGLDVVGNRIGIGPIRVAHAIYSFANDGGAISTLTPVQTAALPAYAIIWGGVVNPTTAPTGTAGATLAVGTSAGSNTTSLLTATTIADLTIDLLVPMAPTLAVPIKLSAAGNITCTIATHAFTAGIIELFVFYTVATNA